MTLVRSRSKLIIIHLLLQQRPSHNLNFVSRNLNFLFHDHFYIYIFTYNLKYFLSSFIFLTIYLSICDPSVDYLETMLKL